MTNQVTESMESHFDDCASNYDQHTINDLGKKEIYDAIEQQMSACKYPKHILVLGCGTGLEIERIQHDAIVTALDVSAEMIKKLKAKTLNENVKLRTVQQSFIHAMFTNDKFDLILSTDSMHYFNKEQKLTLYRNINHWLKPTGYFINCDLVAKDQDDQNTALKEAKAVYDSEEQEFGTLHMDTPLDLETEEALLREAGFAEVSMPRRWTESVMLKAVKTARRGGEEEEDSEENSEMEAAQEEVTA